VSAWRFSSDGGLVVMAAASRAEQSRGHGRAGRTDGRYFVYRPALRFSGSSIPKTAVQIRYDGLQRGRPLGLVAAQQFDSVWRPITEESRAQPPPCFCSSAQAMGGF